MTKQTLRINGFTLIETTVVAGLLSILMLIVITTWINGTESFSIINFAQARDSALTETYYRIDTNVRTAIAFPTTYTDNTDPAHPVTYTQGPKTIILQLHSLTLDKTSDCNNADYVIYDVEGAHNDTLHELLFASPTSTRGSHNQTLLTGLTSFTFTTTPPSTGIRHTVVSADATISQTISRRTISKSQSETMVARNDF